MAYLDPRSLSCPGCGTAAPVTWIVGEGPNTKPGEGPAYISALDDGYWRVEIDPPGVSVRCPGCGTQVARRSP